MKKVSVIIPFYSNVGWLEEALESVRKQTYTNLEVIVVNDGSAEDLKCWLADNEHGIQYYYKSNGGPASARNLGIEKATGDFIAFLDSDDIWVPEKIEKQVAFLETNIDFKWCHCTYLKFFDEDRGVFSPAGTFNGGDLFQLYLLSCPIATPCVLLRAELLKEDTFLRFEESLRYGEDTLFWFKLLAGFKLGYIDEPLVNVRLRGKNAAVQPHVQLWARNQIHIHIHKSGGAIGGRMVGIGTRVIYQLAHCGFVSYKRTGEKVFLAKLFYFPAWILFKSFYKALK